MRLFVTQRSHFSRKIRLLLDHMKQDYTLEDIGNVAATDAEYFAGNPLMTVPVLKDAGRWIVESDHIAHYIVQTYDPADPYRVLGSGWRVMNTRAVMNGIMANDVKLVLSARMGTEPGEHAYFRKAKTAIGQGLAWLESHADMFTPEAPGYAEFHFISLWDHLRFYEVAPLAYSRLARVAATLSRTDTVRRSAPQ